MANYYPDQSTMLQMTTIRRERLLPPDVVGTVLVKEHERVNAITTLARGVRFSRYVLLDLARMLDETDPETLASLVHVAPLEPFREGQVIAGDKERGRNLVRAPVSGMMTKLLDGRMIVQTGLEEVNLQAGFNGIVTALRGNRGVLLETTGTLVQGVWGNGRANFGLLQHEPEGGLVALEVDEFATQWRGANVISTQPVTKVAIDKAIAQGIGGIVAPSMHGNLRKIALDLKIPIMLTEGFGTQRMSVVAQQVLEAAVGRQAALDARQPQHWQADRPEVIVPLHSEQTVAAPSRNEPLRVGAEVRITRAPHLGVVGKIKHLPQTPQVIDNGLRLPVAVVNLPSGRTVTVPLVNLELFGRG